MTALRERALEVEAAGEVELGRRLRHADLQLCNVRWYAGAAIAAGATCEQVLAAAAAGCELTATPEQRAGVA